MWAVCLDVEACLSNDIVFKRGSTLAITTTHPIPFKCIAMVVDTESWKIDHCKRHAKEIYLRHYKLHSKMEDQAILAMHRQEFEQ